MELTLEHLTEIFQKESRSRRVLPLQGKDIRTHIRSVSGKGMIFHKIRVVPRKMLKSFVSCIYCRDGGLFLCYRKLLYNVP